MSANVTWQTGTPLTARCSTCAADVARGTGGTLRANYTGQDVSLTNPSADAFFNTTAFSIPDAGTFGNSLRNLIVGPGSRQLNAQLTRDVAFGGNRNVSISVNANNLLNTVNFCRSTPTSTAELRAGAVGARDAHGAPQLPVQILMPMPSPSACSVAAVAASALVFTLVSAAPLACAARATSARGVSRWHQPRPVDVVVRDKDGTSCVV